MYLVRYKPTLFCNLQSRAQTHAVLVIGLHELLGNPTTYLIEPPGPWLSGVDCMFKYIGCISVI
jgi:hypothetical protein